MNKKIINCRNLKKFNEARERDEGLLIGYLLAGDPSVEEFLKVAADAVMAGVDVLEVGVPSVNPISDGEIIKRGHKRVLELKPDINPADFRFWERLRKSIDTPIWAMGYSEELKNTGLYLELARQKLIDGLVLPDCSLEVTAKIALEIECFQVDVIRFAHPYMSDTELKNSVTNAGIVYTQLYTGPTGNLMAKFDNIATLLEKIRNNSHALILAGFGVRNAETTRKLIEEGFDGVIVGSALMARYERAGKDSLYRFIADIKLKTFRKDYTLRE